MRVKKTVSLFFAFVFMASMFLGTATAVTQGGPVSMLNARYCYITNPVDGATISGTVQITVDASARPAIYIDGVRVARAYSYSWDTTGSADGTHTIYAKARGASDTIQVTVSNGGTVNNPPVVTITAPSNGATVSGTTTISV
ncbi:MAG: Ig-like domain-containing protein, partial [Candidatus Thorarchaeota archaeon]